MQTIFLAFPQLENFNVINLLLKMYKCFQKP